MAPRADAWPAAPAALPSHPGSPSSLTIRALSKRFDETPVVRDLSLDVQPGELISLLGPSGCGKTTTLRMVAGFERPDAGSIRIDGALMAGDRTYVAPERRRVGMVFQEYALFPHMSVAQNVGFGLSRGRDRAGRVEEMLTLVGLEGSGDRFPSDLSGGQQQRVAVARALAPRPAIILLDEPFSNLDQSLRVHLRDEIRRILKAAETTAVLVTHDQEEALSISDRVGVMIDGQIRQLTTPEELHHYPVDQVVAEFVGDAQFIPGVALGTTVTTALGSLALHCPAQGPALVLIRPEMVRITGDDGPDSDVNAVVHTRRFHGRDQTLVVMLADGIRISVRASSYAAFSIGATVRLSVRGEVVAFPR